MTIISFPFISLKHLIPGFSLLNSAFIQKEEATDKLPPRLNLKSVMLQNSLPVSV